MSTETENLASDPITYQQVGELALALLDIVPDNAVREAVMRAVIESFRLSAPTA